MLELIAIILLVGRMESLVTPKGYKSDWFKSLAVGLWFAGEALGFIIGLMLAGGSLWSAYILAILGALVGAIIAYWMANHPSFTLRWWKLIASILVVIVFFVVGFATIDQSQPALIIAVGFIFIGVVMATILQQYLIENNALLAILFGVTILAWIILAANFILKGYDYYSEDGYMPLSLSAAGVTLLLTIVTIVYAISKKDEVKFYLA